MLRRGTTGLDAVAAGHAAWPGGGRALRQAFALAADRPLAPGVAFRTPSLDELLSPPWLRPY